MSFAVRKVALRIFPSTLYTRSVILPVQTPYLNCNITVIRKTFGQNLNTFRGSALSDNGEQCKEFFSISVIVQTLEEVQNIVDMYSELFCLCIINTNVQTYASLLFEMQT